MVASFSSFYEGEYIEDIEDKKEGDNEWENVE